MLYWRKLNFDGLAMLSEWAMKEYLSVCCMENCQRGEGLLAVNLKRYKDFFKSFPKVFEMNEFRESLAAERSTWRNLIRKGAESYEQTRIRQAWEKRPLRKSSAAETGSAIITALPYPNCDRTVRARIGLISHIWTDRLHATNQWCHGHHPHGWANMRVINVQFRMHEMHSHPNATIWICTG